MCMCYVGFYVIRFNNTILSNLSNKTYKFDSFLVIDHNALTVNVDGRAGRDK